MSERKLFGEEEMKIEQWMLDEAKKAGACDHGYKVGQDISEVSMTSLFWVDENMSSIVAKLNLKYPLWVYSAGDGYGYSYGDGYGSNYGSNCGDGYGCGVGGGSGYGCGVGGGYGLKKQMQQGEIK